MALLRSAVAAAAGKKAANAEASQPSADVPWWMRVHGEEPHVTCLEEVMEQFLDEEDMCTLQAMGDRATKKTDMRAGAVLAVIPGADTSEVEALHGWSDHVQKFLHYRGLVRQKHEHTERKNQPGRRRGGNGKGESDSDSDSNSSESVSVAYSSEATNGGASPRQVGKGKQGGRWQNVKPRLHDRRGSSPVAPGSRSSRRPSQAMGASAGSIRSSFSGREDAAPRSDSRMSISSASFRQGAGAAPHDASPKLVCAASIAIGRMAKNRAKFNSNSSTSAKAGPLQSKNFTSC